MQAYCTGQDNYPVSVTEAYSLATAMIPGLLAPYATLSPLQYKDMEQVVEMPMVAADALVLFLVEAPMVTPDTVELAPTE